METRSQGLMLELTRIFPKPAAAVFAAFTDPDRLVDWWGPQGFTIPSLSFQARAGERYRIKMQPPQGDAFYLTGEIREVESPARLAYTFAWEDPDPEDVETLVVLSFADLGGSTQVSLRQGAFRTDGRRALHRDGWSESFDKLERLLADQVD